MNKNKLLPFVNGNVVHPARVAVVVALALLVALGGCHKSKNRGAAAAPTTPPVSGTDTTPPTVSSTAPLNAATGVATNGALSVTFSEAMDPASLTSASFTLTGGGAVAGAVSYSGTTAVFTPGTTLAPNTLHTATVTTSARDLAGNALTANYTWSFTTGAAADTTPPTVTGTNPANGATNVPTGSPVSITFSEPMNPATITTASVALSTGGNAVSGALTYSGATATFTPTATLAPNANYTLTVTTGARDLAGNALPAPVQAGFTTGLVARYAYVANKNNGVDAAAISIYAVEAASGQLRHRGYAALQTTVAGSPAPAQAFLGTVAVHPTGRFVYAAIGGGSPSNKVWAFGADSATGALSAIDLDSVTPGIQELTISSISYLYHFAIEPGGRFAYAVGVDGSGRQSIAAYAIDATSGALTAIDADASSPGLLFDLGTGYTSANLIGTHTIAFAPGGGFAYVVHVEARVWALAIDPATGALSAVAGSPFATGTAGTPGTGQVPIAIALDPAGRFAYTANRGTFSGGGNDVTAFRVDAGTGALTVIDIDPATPGIQNIAAGNRPNSVAVDATGRFVYVANNFSNDVSAYRIDPSSGALTAIDCGGGAGCNGVRFAATGAGLYTLSADASGRFLHAGNATSNDVSTWRIDPATGALSRQGSVTARDGAASIAFLNGASAVSATPKFLYGTNRNSNDVSAFAINATTGALTQVNCGAPYVCGATVPANFAAGLGARSVAVNPGGSFAYVANDGSVDISAYGIDAATGALGAIDADPLTAGIQNFAASNAALDVSVDPSGRFVNSQGGIFAIGAGGALTRVPLPVPNPAGYANAIGATPHAADPAGKFVYRMNNNIERRFIDAATGLVTPSTVVATVLPECLALHPSGKFAYAAASVSLHAYHVDAAGAFTAVAGSPFTIGSRTGTGIPRGCMAVTPAGETVYVTNGIQSTISAFRVDTATGVLTELSGSPFAAGGVRPEGIAIDPSGRFAYTANYTGDTISAYAIDPATGALSNLATLPAGDGTWDIDIVGVIQ